MARPSNSDLLSRYLNKIILSKRWRKDEAYDETWKRLNDLYRGRHYEYFTDEDRVLINMVFSTVNVISPSISVNYPKITVAAVSPENAPNAVIAEAVVNYWWKHKKIKDQFRRAVKDFILFGHGWLKVGYRYVEEERIGEDEDVSDPNVPENVMSTNYNVLEDAPFVERVSPFDVFVDPDGTSMDDIKWIAHRIRRPIRDAKSDKRYSKAGRDEIKAVSFSRYSEDEPRYRKINDTNEGYCDIYEFYDLRNNTVSVFADGSSVFLIKPQKMPYAFGHPFVMIRNYDVPDFFYPIGDVEAIEPLQRELNETRTQMMNHRKRYARKYLFRESALDTAGRTAMESDEDNVMVPVVGDHPLGDVVTPFPALINPPEFYNQSSLIEQDINTISGVGEFMRGGVSEIRRTATEVGLVQDAANARTADKLATIELAIADVAKRLLMLTQQFQTQVMTARIIGRNGEPVWVKYDRDYIAGDFDFDVVGGSTMPNNESARRGKALDMLSAVVPFAQAGIVDMSKLATYVLQTGFDVKNAEAFIKQPEPAPEPAAPPMPPSVPAPEVGGLPPEMMGGAPPEGGIPPELLALLGGAEGGMPPEAGMPMGF